MQIIVLQKKSQRMQHSNNDVLKPTKKKPKYSAKYITVTIKYTKDNCSTYLNSVRDLRVNFHFNFIKNPPPPPQKKTKPKHLVLSNHKSPFSMYYSILAILQFSL